MNYNIDELRDYYETVSEFKYYEMKRILSDILKGNINIKESKFQVWTEFLLESTNFNDIELYIIRMELNK